MKNVIRVLSLVLILALILPVQALEQVTYHQMAEALAQKPANSAQISTQATPGKIQQPGKEEIAAKWATVTSASTIFATEPSVVAPYATGSLTEDFLESGITYLNYVRFVAGLPEVTLDPTLNVDAQHGAVVLAAVDYLSHYPHQPADMDDAFYDRGAAATASANISARWGYPPLTSLQSAVQGCMDDSGDNNLATVGHRRWLLNPTLGKVGFGYAKSDTDWSYIVTSVFDRSGTGCSFDFISWPVAGNHPTNLFNTQNPWSVTLNSSVYRAPSAASVKITVTRKSDGKQWSFDSTTGQPSTHTEPYMIVNNDWYGLPNCIIFHPGSNNVDGYAGVFQVKITGIYYKDGTAAELEYDVDFFDINAVECAHNYTSVITAPTCEEQGYTTYTCSKCGDSYVADYTNPVDHVYEGGCCVWCGEPEILASGICGDDLTWVLTADGVLTISGTGAMYDYEYMEAPWCDYLATIVQVVVEDGATRIGNNAFREAVNLTGVSLSDTITEIGSWAFMYAEKLSAITLPRNLTSLEQQAFLNCYALKEIELPGTLTFIDSGIFSGCTSLTRAVIHADPDAPSLMMGDGIFRSCTSLEAIEVDEDHFCLKSIDGVLYNYSAEGLSLLQYPSGKQDAVFQIPEGTYDIFQLAMENVDALEELIIPDGVQTIGVFAFQNCDNLHTIRFLGDAPEFGEDVVWGMTVTAYYPAGNETWTEEVMQDYGGTITWVSYGEEVTNYVKWYSGTTSLNGTIDLNIYVLLSDDLVNADDTYVRFTYAGKTVDVPMADALYAPLDTAPNRYRFSCPIYAKQLTDAVNVKFMKGEQMIGKELNYSVVTYCKNRINNSTDPAEVAICKAMLNYGAASQLLFNYNTDNLANASLSDADKVLKDVDASAYKYSVAGSESGIKAKSATLMLEDVVKVRVYFTLTGNKSIDDYTFTIDGEVVTPQYNDKGWYVETDGIAAKDLEKMFRVQVGGITVTYGALSYVNSKVNGSNTLEANISKALYAYWQAAEALLG